MIKLLSVCISLALSTKCSWLKLLKVKHLRRDTCQSLRLCTTNWKTPIVVNDSRGFFTSRVFGTFIQEGMRLLAEGVHPARIEMVALKAGMPVGPSLFKMKYL